MPMFLWKKAPKWLCVAKFNLLAICLILIELSHNNCLVTYITSSVMIFPSVLPVIFLQIPEKYLKSYICNSVAELRSKLFYAQIYALSLNPKLDLVIRVFQDSPVLLPVNQLLYKVYVPYNLHRLQRKNEAVPHIVWPNLHYQ